MYVGVVLCYTSMHMHTSGEYNPDGCYTCGTMVADDEWYIGNISFADLRLHRLHDTLPNCEAVHNMLTDEQIWRQSEHRICLDCSDIVFVGFAARVVH